MTTALYIKVVVTSSSIEPQIMSQTLKIIGERGGVIFEEREGATHEGRKDVDNKRVMRVRKRRCQLRGVVKSPTSLLLRTNM